MPANHDMDTRGLRTICPKALVLRASSTSSRKSVVSGWTDGGGWVKWVDGLQNVTKREPILVEGTDDANCLHQAVVQMLFGLGQ